jgi:hypothetical protein
MSLIKRSTSSIITALPLSAAAFVLVACETPFGKDDGASVANYQTSSGGSGGSAIAVFTSGFYAFAVKNCAQCHGSTQTPLFAVSNVNTAYAAAETVVNFSNPASSVLAVYAGNGHCGISNCNGQTSTVIPLLESWATAEANTSAPTTGSSAGAGLVPPSAGIAYFSTAVTIPANIPGPGNTFSIMRWPLSQLTPASAQVTGGYFEMQIQLLTPTTYRITMPKLAAANATIVTSVHVMIKPAGTPGNGQEDPLAMDWATINQNVAGFTIPNPLPTTSLNVTALTPDAMELPVLSASDQLVIGFDALGIGTNETACSNLSGTNGFVSNVLPQMTSICFSCHLAGGAGNGAFPMVNNNNTALCATTLGYINVNNPSGSMIVVNPQGNNGHPNVGTGFNPAPFIEWIETE